jgi:3-methyladenine DNA glycosylase AlkC
LGEFDSLAGSGATYLGTDNFRIRRLGENGARLHLPVNGKTYRTRDEYVAVDINLDLLKEAIEKM